MSNPAIRRNAPLGNGRPAFGMPLEALCWFAPTVRLIEVHRRHRAASVVRWSHHDRRQTPGARTFLAWQAPAQ
jgi:hypothetical protein